MSKWRMTFEDREDQGSGLPALGRGGYEYWDKGKNFAIINAYHCKQGILVGEGECFRGSRNCDPPDYLDLRDQEYGEPEFEEQWPNNRPVCRDPPLHAGGGGTREGYFSVYWDSRDPLSQYRVSETQEGGTTDCNNRGSVDPYRGSRIREGDMWGCGSGTSELREGNVSGYYTGDSPVLDRVWENQQWELTGSHNRDTPIQIPGVTQELNSGEPTQRVTPRQKLPDYSDLSLHDSFPGKPSLEGQVQYHAASPQAYYQRASDTEVQSVPQNLKYSGKTDWRAFFTKFS